MPRIMPSTWVPSTSGSPRSSTTTSGDCVDAPVPARPSRSRPTCTACPRRDNARCSAIRIAASSSIRHQHRHAADPTVWGHGLNRALRGDLAQESARRGERWNTCVSGLLAISGWLVAAVLAVGLSWSAISVVRELGGAAQPVGDGPAAPERVRRPATPDGTRPPARPTAGRGARHGPVRAARSTVRCVNGRPTIVNVTPRQGFPAETRRQRRRGAVPLVRPPHRDHGELLRDYRDRQVEEHADGGGGGGGDDHGGGRGGGSGSRPQRWARRTAAGQPRANSEAPVGQVEDRLRHDAEDDRRGDADHSAVIVSGDGSAIVGPSAAGSEKYMSTTIRT